MSKIFSQKLNREGYKTRILLRNEILRQNVDRLIYLAAIGTPVSLLHILIFFMNQPGPGTVEYSWNMGIIISHSFLSLFLLTIGTISFYYKKTGKPGRNSMQAIIYSFFVLFILIAVAITSIDQLVTTAITPFLIICTLLSAFFLIRPGLVFLFFSTGLIFLGFSMHATQADSSVLQSNVVNGLTAITIAFGLSVVMWNLFITKMKQSFTINEQARLLEIRNKKLKEETEKQLSLIQTRDKFFSIIAHDLKSPLNGVLGLTEIMLENRENISRQDIVKYITLIGNSTRQTYFLLENLLEWAQMQQNQFSFSPEKINLYHLAKKTQELFQENAAIKNIRCNIQIPEDFVVTADKSMLSSILRNLVSNAIKFTGKGGRINISAKNNGEMQIIEVSDNGVGIAPETLDKLFSEQWNTSSYGTQNEKGTGLGLMLCKEFAGQHGGKIEVQSHPGEGSTFSVFLPLMPK